MIIKQKPRLQGWEDNLDALLHTYPQKEYVFGVDDCFHMFVEAEFLLTGATLWGKYLDYKTYKTAMLFRKKFRDHRAYKILDKAYAKGNLENPESGDFSIFSTNYDMPVFYLYHKSKDCWVTHQAPAVILPPVFNTVSITRSWSI